MIPTDIKRAEAWEDTGFKIRARVEGSTGGNLTSTGVTLLAGKVYDKHNRSATVHTWNTTSPTASSGERTFLRKISMTAWFSTPAS